jgi:predicted RNA binding protein YcfA (HicA-like mRNA interferase family)
VRTFGSPGCRILFVPRPKKPDDVVRILRAHDNRFVCYSNRGKGSERMIYHPDIGGRSQCYPMTYHKGRDVGKGMLKAIIRRFGLPANIFD